MIWWSYELTQIGNPEFVQHRLLNKNDFLVTYSGVYNSISAS
jgi:hypothetical protein